MINPQINSPIEGALYAASIGFYVFPCKPDKTPMVKWADVATRDEAQIERWWDAYPNAMVGAATGITSGFFVIDIDVKDGVDAYTKWAALEDEHGKIVPEFVTRTASGGLHLFLKMPEGADIRNSAGKLGAGIDVRGNCGYVIFAGSYRADGEAYTFVNGGDYA